MPTSSPEGKAWLADRILALNPFHLLDLGPGLGTYARLLRPSLPESWFACIEIWEPYVAEFSLDLWYNEVIIADATTTTLPSSDVIIMGDIIEHLSLPDAVRLWDRARLAAPHVFASIPLIHCPQEQYDNPHEQHLVTWDHPMVLSTLAGIDDFWTGSIIGTYHAMG